MKEKTLATEYFKNKTAKKESSFHTKSHAVQEPRSSRFTKKNGDGLGNRNEKL